MKKILVGLILSGICFSYGLAKAEDSLYTKATKYEANLQKSHLDQNQLVSIRVEDDGTQHFDDVEDSAIWTGLYVATEAWQYKTVTEQAEKDSAHANLVNALKALFRLQDNVPQQNNALGQKGIVARYIESNGKPRDKEASKDTYTGVLFGYYVAYSILDDNDTDTDGKTFKQKIKEHVQDVGDNFLQNNYSFKAGSINDYPQLNNTNVNLIPNVTLSSVINGVNKTAKEYQEKNNASYVSHLQDSIIDSAQIGGLLSILWKGIPGLCQYAVDHWNTPEDQLDYYMKNDVIYIRTHYKIQEVSSYGKLMSTIVSTLQSINDAYTNPSGPNSYLTNEQKQMSNFFRRILYQIPKNITETERIKELNNIISDCWTAGITLTINQLLSILHEIPGIMVMTKEIITFCVSPADYNVGKNTLFYYLDHPDEIPSDKSAPILKALLKKNDKGENILITNAESVKTWIDNIRSIEGQLKTFIDEYLPEQISKPEDLKIASSQALLGLYVLKVCYFITGDVNFKDAYDSVKDDFLNLVLKWTNAPEDLIRNIFGDKAVYAYGIGGTHHLPWLALYALLDLEKDGTTEKKYIDILKKRIKYINLDYNSFFNFIYAAYQRGSSEIAINRGVLSLLLFPQYGLMPVDYSNNLDAQKSLGGKIVFFGDPGVLNAVQLDKRPRDFFIWQRSPRRLTCGEDFNKRIYPGLDYLFAYWLGRYWNFSYDYTDRRAPTVIDTYPKDGSVISPGLFTIKCWYSDNYLGVEEGLGIDTSSIRFFIDSRELTSQANITLFALTYTPSENLDIGVHTVKVIIKDKAGNQTQKDWSFTINAVAGDLPDLTIPEISLSDTQPVEGNNVTITAKILNQGMIDVASTQVNFYIDDFSNPYKTVTVGPILGYKTGGDASGTYEVQQGVPTFGSKTKTREWDLHLTDPSHELFGETSITIDGDNEHGGTNYDDGCVKVDFSNGAWSNIRKANITKYKNYIHILATVKASSTIGEGRFQADISIKGRKASAPVDATVTWKANQIGAHAIRVYVDPYNQIYESDGSNNVADSTIRVRQNNPPHTPTLSGLDSGLVNKSCIFKASSSDPDLNKIKFVFDWGDGTTTETDYGDYGSDGTVTKSVSHIWGIIGTYNVRVKAVDEGEKESRWSDRLRVKIRDVFETKPILSQRQVYNPTLCTEGDKTLYLTATTYVNRKNSQQTVIEFLKSSDEGENFTLDERPWSMVGNTPIEVKTAVTSNENKHGVFEYGTPAEIYKGYYDNSEHNIDKLDEYFSGADDENNTATWSYNCTTPDMVSYGNSLAAIWIRKSAYKYPEVNDDNLCLGISYDSGMSWEKKCLTYSIPHIGGARYVNPSITVDKNGNLFIASFLVNGVGNYPYWNVLGWGIYFYRVPYTGGWDTSKYPAGPVYIPPMPLHENDVVGVPVYISTTSIIENYTEHIFPNICVNKDNNIHIVFEYPLYPYSLNEEGKYSVYHAISVDKGKTWQGVTNYAYFDQGKWPNIAADSSGKVYIVWVKDSDVWYLSPAGERRMISTGRGKVNSKPQIVSTSNYLHVVWSESEDETEGKNSIYYSRLQLISTPEISQVSCSPEFYNSLGGPCLDVPPYYDDGIMPKEIGISFKITDYLSNRCKINVEIYTEDGTTLIRRIIMDQIEDLTPDPDGGYSRYFENYVIWDGMSDGGKYVDAMYYWKIKITAQEIDNSGHLGAIGTNGDFPGSNNKNFIFTDPTFIQPCKKDMKAFNKFIEEEFLNTEVNK